MAKVAPGWERATFPEADYIRPGPTKAAVFKNSEMIDMTEPYDPSSQCDILIFQHINSAFQCPSVEF